MKSFFTCGIALCLSLCIQSLRAETPRRDGAVFIPNRDACREQLRERAGKEAEPPPKPEITLDLAGMDLPGSPGEFETVRHFPPVCQDLTGSCWAFSAVSFFESEISRLVGRDIRLSEPYTIYWEWMAKALRFIGERGVSYFSIGSQPNAAVRVWKEYGIVPADAYPSAKSEASIFEDRELFSELKDCVQSLANAGKWDVPGATDTLRAILDRYMGPPPATIAVGGVEMPPRDYLRDICRLELDSYVNLLSLAEEPYHTWVEYRVPDNWWYSRDYYNVPLGEFMSVIGTALRSGYSVCVAGDTSEAGYLFSRGIAMVPTFDIPPDFIDENARQLRFAHGTTTDDHAFHLVGWVERGGAEWFLAKDSSTKAWNAPYPGYIFIHEDFVRLKVLNLLVHRDVVRRAVPGFAGSPPVGRDP